MSSPTSAADVMRAPCGHAPPTAGCVASVHRWALNETHTAGFRVQTANGLKVIARQLARTLLPCTAGTSAAERPLVVDVGAAMHSTEMYFKRMNPDDSDALYLLAGFGANADVHAFDANADKAQQIVDVAQRRSQTAPYVHRLTVHAEGVSDTVRRDRVAMCDEKNTWQLATTGPGQHRRCPLGGAVNVTTLDAFAAGRPILYAKVDVEGGELQVVHGMRRLLRERAIELASFEYGVNWHPLFHKMGALTADERRALPQNATLRNFEATLSAHGYDTYLIHATPPRWMGPPQHRTTRSKHAEPIITLLPIYGPFWHPAFEICADRGRFYGHLGHCWNDLLVMPHGSGCVKRRMLEWLHGTDDVYPECHGCF